MTGSDLQRIDDAELVRRAISAGGDPDALGPVLEAIAERYRDAVLRWCANKGLDHQAALDVGQTVFLDAFTSLADGRGPTQGELLGRWLAGFVKNRARAHFRTSKSAGQVMLSADDSFDDFSDDDEERSGFAQRLAHANRLVNVVVTSLDERYRSIYQLYFVEQLTGHQIAERLKINEKTASNRVTRVRQVVADGFGALILAQEGRTYCPVLAGILDAAQVQMVTEDNFTAALRIRIVRHFDTCDSCDRCGVCADKRRQLVGPYAPALIPVLFGVEFRERVAEIIRQVCDRRSRSPRPKRRRNGPRPRMRVPLAVGALLVVAVIAVVVLEVLPGHSRPLAATASSTRSRASGTVHNGKPGVPLVWRQLRTLTDPDTSGVRSIAISPDGKTLVAGHFGGGLYVWDLGRSQLTGTLSSGTSPSAGADVMSLAFSPDGKMLAAGLGTGQIVLRDASSTQTVATLDDGYGKGGVNSLAFSPDGKTLATGTLGNPGMVVLWNLATDNQITAINPSLGAVASVAFSPDGKALAIGGDGGTVLWDISTGSKTNITAATVASGPVLSVAFSPDGKVLAIGGFQGVVLRDLQASRNTAILPVSGAALAFSPDSATLATGQDGVYLWMASVGRKIASFSDQQVMSVAFLQHGTVVAASNGNGVTMWTSAS